MLFFIQYTFLDLRELSTVPDKCKLTSPCWPSPIAYNEFIRSYGQIVSRKNGGLENWVGEHSICRADKAIKFNNSPAKILNTKFPCVAKHLYHDGLFLTKLVLVFKPRKPVLVREKLMNEEFSLKSELLKNIFNSLMSNEITVKCNGTPVSSSVLHAGQSLAKSILYATSPNIFPIDEAYYYSCGTPDLFISSTTVNEKLTKENSINRIKHTKILNQNQPHDIWFIESHGLQTGDVMRKNRDIRICLMRYVSECTLLTHFLKKINELPPNHISFDKGTPQNKLLNHYLNLSTRRFFRGKKKLSKLTHSTDIKDIALITINKAWRGRIKELENSYKAISIKRQIKLKLDNLILLSIKNNYGDLMTNKYVAQNVGAQGEGAINIGSAVGAVKLTTEDVEQLIDEISQLKKSLQAENNKPLIADLALTEESLRKNNSLQAFNVLKRIIPYIKEPVSKLSLTTLTELIKKLVSEL